MNLFPKQPISKDTREVQKSDPASNRQTKFYSARVTESEESFWRPIWNTFHACLRCTSITSWNYHMNFVEITKMKVIQAVIPIAQELSLVYKESRLAACNYWMTFTEDWIQRVIYEQTKNGFVLQQSINKRTTYTGVQKTHMSNTRGTRETKWGIVSEWWNVSVYFEVYLEQLGAERHSIAYS